ncbi:hypothetical protein SAMN04489832_4132 [Micromonospora cremea]|uniref:Uncharacterized protein n=1 Tax=Micromonospora cremea TaxID=709881 RepID=A0A1N5ZKR9_9ACTN|nr:hypothetical protein SAMN04489832_4132 [Micromonospora cremea]
MWMRCRPALTGLTPPPGDDAGRWPPFHPAAGLGRLVGRNAFVGQPYSWVRAVRALLRIYPGPDTWHAGSQLIERVYDKLVVVEIRGRWWNGSWGRIARRDIWLTSDGQVCRVRGRLGGDEGQEVSYDFPDEASARAMADRMMKTSAGITWRDLTEAVRQESIRRKAH